MTALTAGYAVAIVAMLIAASAALTIIFSVGRFGYTGEEPSQEERPRKAAA